MKETSIRVVLIIRYLLHGKNIKAVLKGRDFQEIFRKLKKERFLRSNVRTCVDKSA